MRGFMKGRSKKAGLPPGTPVHVGEPRTEEVTITLIDYDQSQCIEKEVESVAECGTFRQTPTVSWVNVTGVHDVEVLNTLGRTFDLHPLLVEDIANTTQRPKADEYDDCLYVSLRMLSPGQDKVEAEQVSLVLGSSYVLSLQEKPGDVFDPVRIRIRQGKGRIRQMGPDYLLYCLLDAIVDGYFAVCEFLGEKMEALQDQLLAELTPTSLGEIHVLKREVVVLRRSVWPLRDVVSTIQRSEAELISAETRLYLRDVYDHTIQIMDTIETYRDTVGGMAELYLSSVSNRMNEVMKVLTIIATIFIPLGFIAGLYGMNFANMPELQLRWGYPAVLLVMAGVVVGMLAYFKNKNWI